MKRKIKQCMIAAGILVSGIIAGVNQKDNITDLLNKIGVSSAEEKIGRWAEYTTEGGESLYLLAESVISALYNEKSTETAEHKKLIENLANHWLKLNRGVLSGGGVNNVDDINDPLPAGRTIILDSQ